jgi:hypothetical protein
MNFMEATITALALFGFMYPEKSDERVFGVNLAALAAAGYAIYLAPWHVLGIK